MDDKFWLTISRIISIGGALFALIGGIGLLIFSSKISKKNEILVNDLKSRNQTLEDKIRVGEEKIMNNQTLIEKKGEQIDNLEKGIPEKNRIIYLASEISSNSSKSRIALSELQRLSNKSNFNQNRQLAKRYLIEICDKFTKQYDKDFKKHIINKKKLFEIQSNLEMIEEELLGIDFNKEKPLSDTASSLTWVNKLFGTDFTICSLNRYHKWVKNKYYLQIINENLN